MAGECTTPEQGRSGSLRLCSVEEEERRLQCVPNWLSQAAW